MATISYTIHSHYTPPPKSQVTPGEQENETSDLLWATQSAEFGSKPRGKQSVFVPAGAQYDEWGMPASFEAGPSRILKKQKDGGIGNWYSSIPRNQQASPNPRYVVESVASTSTSTLPSTTQPASSKPITSDKKMWFISSALSSASSSSSSKPARPAPTMAEILADSPPALGDDAQPFVPRTFLAIGPANRGFKMMQRSGWREGETLGTAMLPVSSPSGESREDLETKLPLSKRRRKVVDLAALDERVVDLTLESDSESSDLEDDPDESTPPSPSRPHTRLPVTGGTQTALSTPLPTVLKPDRLGIGLKPASRQKTVTHSTGDVRRAEQKARQMQHRTRFGRGQRGFARANAKESTKRRDVLAYLNW